ncbi:homeobox SEBOX, partial [Paramuricea clavata]
MENSVAARILVNMSRTSMCEEEDVNRARDVNGGEFQYEQQTMSEHNVPMPLPVVSPYVLPWSLFAPQQFMVQAPVSPSLTGVSPLSVWPGIMAPRRRTRHKFSEYEVDVLERTFNSGVKYPTVGDRLRMASQLNFPERRIYIWFQNRRARSTE